MGPSRQRVEDYIRLGGEEGPKLVAGGGPAGCPGAGFYGEPRFRLVPQRHAG